MKQNGNSGCTDFFCPLKIRTSHLSEKKSTHPNPNICMDDPLDPLEYIYKWEISYKKSLLINITVKRYT